MLMILMIVHGVKLTFSTLIMIKNAILYFFLPVKLNTVNVAVSNTVTPFHRGSYLNAAFQTNSLCKFSLLVVDIINSRK